MTGDTVLTGSSPGLAIAGGNGRPATMTGDTVLTGSSPGLAIGVDGSE